VNEKDLAVVCQQIGVFGGAYYFELETLEIGEGLGLDGFEFYFIGRGGVLGDVEPAAVASAFGYFNPTLVEQTWVSAREKIAPREGARAYASASHAFGRSNLAELPGLGALCAALEVVNQAADGRGLPLYAASAAEPVPDDLPARTMHLLTVLRELRGSAHLVAVIASGLDPKIAHYLRRPYDMEMFGWAGDETIEVTDEDRGRLQRADELTDRLVAGAYGALDAAASTALLDGLAAVDAAL
jgi:hypothetical protein